LNIDAFLDFVWWSIVDYGWVLEKGHVDRESCEQTKHELIDLISILW
jgi:hypothetical protein